MNENVQVIYIVPPESARFVNQPDMSTSQYLLFDTMNTSVVPDSYDQILKNHTLPVSGPQVQYKD